MRNYPKIKLIILDILPARITIKNRGNTMKNLIKIFEILILILCVAYLILYILGIGYTIFSDFEYWGCPQWPWYMRDKTTFIIYSFSEIFVLLSVFSYACYCAYTKNKHYMIILLICFTLCYSKIVWFSFFHNI